MNMCSLTKMWNTITFTKTIYKISPFHFAGISYQKPQPDYQKGETNFCCQIIWKNIQFFNFKHNIEARNIVTSHLIVFHAIK